MDFLGQKYGGVMVMREEQEKWIITVESIPATFPGLAIIVDNYSIPAYRRSRGTYCGIGTLVASFRYFHTAGHIRGQNITASFIEDRLLDARIGCAQGFPVSKGRVSR